MEFPYFVKNPCSMLYREAIEKAELEKGIEERRQKREAKKSGAKT